MADPIFATVVEVQRKVHVNASSTSNVEAYILQFGTEVESYINATVRFNFSDKYATLNVDVQGILKMALTEMVALMVEGFDLEAIGRSTSIAAANSHLLRFNLAMATLKDKKKEDFITKA